jgi:anti-anti-sigma regulatory factor
MPTRITQITSPNSETSAFDVFGEVGDQPVRSESRCVASEQRTEGTVFKVEGTLNLSDAELLEKICRDVRNETGRPVTLKLDELSYLDSESAVVLCRMKREQNVTLKGLHLFIEKVIELTEESEKVTKYLPKPNPPVE